MKILLVTFDKEMEKKVRELLKDHQIITAKNGEEALLLNIANDVDVVIYDALAGGIAEDDINKLYEEGFNNVPFIILMDDLFPIDPENIKPKLKKIISREVEVDKLPELVQEVAGQKAETKKEEETTSAETTPAETHPEPVAQEAAPQPVEQKTQEEISWDALVETTSEPTVETQPQTTAQEQPQEVKQETPVPAETTTSEASTPTGEISLNKQCLLVSFDMPLVEKIEKLIGDKCDLHIARSAKQALQKYEGKPFDIIIFDTISGVFAEKGIKDLYEKGGYKDSLYVLLLDEFLPLDVDKLPVQNLRTIKRESELELLPEIVESAPHITFGQVVESAAKQIEETPQTEAKEEQPQKVETSQTPVEEKKKEEPQKVETPTPTPTFQPATQPAVQSTPVAQPAVAISEEQLEKIIEQKINEKVIPLIEELIRSKLSEIYIKAIAREILEPQIDESLIRDIIREIAEPIVRETLEELLTQ